MLSVLICLISSQFFSQLCIDYAFQLTLTSTWKEIRRKIKHDPRYSKFSDDDKVIYSTLLYFISLRIQQKMALVLSNILFKIFIREFIC